MVMNLHLLVEAPVSVDHTDRLVSEVAEKAGREVETSIGATRALDRMAAYQKNTRYIVGHDKKTNLIHNGSRGRFSLVRDGDRVAAVSTRAVLLFEE